MSTGLMVLLITYMVITFMLSCAVFNERDSIYKIKDIDCIGVLLVYVFFITAIKVWLFLMDTVHLILTCKFRNKD